MFKWAHLLERCFGFADYPSDGHCYFLFLTVCDNYLVSRFNENLLLLEEQSLLHCGVFTSSSRGLWKRSTLSGTHWFQRKVMEGYYAMSRFSSHDMPQS